MTQLLVIFTQWQADVQALWQENQNANSLLQQLIPHHLSLPVFSGKGSIDNFIDHYEAYTTVQHLTEPQKIDVVIAQW